MRGNMNSVTNLTAKQLAQAAAIKERIEALEAELTQLLGEPAAPVVAPEGPKRRKISRRGLANIRAGVQKRVAARAAPAAAEAPTAPAEKPKRKISAAGRARLRALARARWRKARAEGRTRL